MVERCYPKEGPSHAQTAVESKKDICIYVKIYMYLYFHQKDFRHAPATVSLELQGGHQLQALLPSLRIPTVHRNITLVSDDQQTFSP